MKKKIIELTPNQIEAVVGGVAVVSATALPITAIRAATTVSVATKAVATIVSSSKLI